MKRELTAAQETRLLREHLTGCSGGKWSTMKVLIEKGYMTEKDKNLHVTTKGKNYCDQYHLKIKW